MLDLYLILLVCFAHYFMYVQILNYREIGHTRIHTLVKVGEYGEERGLQLNMSLVLSYDARGDPRPMGDVRSSCFRDCGELQSNINLPQPTPQLSQLQLKSHQETMSYMQVGV